MRIRFFFMLIRFDFYAYPIFFYAHPFPVLCASVWNFLRIEIFSMRRKGKSLLLLEFYGSKHLLDAATGSENHAGAFDRRSFYIVGCRQPL
jgi:hypothetical protein